VQGQAGAEFHPDLRIVDEKTDKMRRSVVYVKKGIKPDIDSYSAFFDNCRLNETSLNADLKKHAINEIYVCGLAADVCVGKQIVWDFKYIQRKLIKSSTH
jgi:nicotinamidase/pyrazinamidase